MKQYYIFDFPLQMYGIGLLFALWLFWIVFRAYRRAKAAGTKPDGMRNRSEG